MAFQGRAAADAPSAMLRVKFWRGPFEKGRSGASPAQQRNNANSRADVPGSGAKADTREVGKVPVAEASALPGLLDRKLQWLCWISSDVSKIGG
jgi:hypothetical protein